MADIKVRLYLTDEIKEELSEDAYIDFYNEDIIRLNTISYTTTQPDTVQYGAFSNDGTIVISDKNGDILNKIHEGLFDNYKYPIEIYLDDEKIATHIIKVRPNYDFAKREITINLADKLYAMDDLQYDGYVYPLESKTAQDVLADVLGKYDDEWGVEPKLVFDARKNTNVPTYTETSGWVAFVENIPSESDYSNEDYRKAEIQYPYLAPQTFRRASSAVLSLMHTSLITDENGKMTPIFMDRYAEDVDNAIIIPIDKTIEPLNPTVILDNKHDNAEVDCEKIGRMNYINTPIDKIIDDNVIKEDYNTPTKIIYEFEKLENNALDDKDFFPIIQKYDDNKAYIGREAADIFSTEGEYFFSTSYSSSTSQNGGKHIVKIMFLDGEVTDGGNRFYIGTKTNNIYKSYDISKYKEFNLVNLIDLNEISPDNVAVLTKREIFRAEIDVSALASFTQRTGERTYFYLPASNAQMQLLKEQYKPYDTLEKYMYMGEINAEEIDDTTGISFKGQRISFSPSNKNENYNNVIYSGYRIEDTGANYRLSIGELAKRTYTYFLYQTSFKNQYNSLGVKEDGFYQGLTEDQKCYKYLIIETPYAITINVNGSTRTITFNDESIKDTERSTNNVLTYGNYGNMLQYEYTQDNIKAEINKYLDYYANGIHTADITVFGVTDCTGEEKSVSIDYVGNNMSISKVTTKLENIDSDSVQIMTYSISPKEDHFGGDTYTQLQDARRKIYATKDNIIFTQKGWQILRKGEEIDVFSIDVESGDTINGAMYYSNFGFRYTEWSAKLTAKFEGTTITFTYTGNKAFELTVPVCPLTARPFKCGDVVEVQNYDGESDLYYRHGLQKGNPIKWQVTRNQVSFNGGNVEQALTLRELPVISEYKNITVLFYSDKSTLFSLGITNNGGTRNLLNNEDFSVSGSFSAYDKTYEFKNLKEKNTYDFGYIKLVRNSSSQAFFSIELYDKTKGDAAGLSLTKSSNLQITSVKF